MNVNSNFMTFDQFGSIDAGTVFMMAGEFYMAIEDTVGEAKAVNLESGQVCSPMWCDMVYVVNATVNIEMIKGE